MSSTRRSPFRLHAQDVGERKISWLELFYDLIYVATIIQLGNRLSDDVSVRGVLLFVLLFVPVWWSWTGMMFYFNRFMVDDGWHRLLVFAQMFAVANLGISVSGAFGDTSATFALAYFAVRAILVLLYLRAWWHVPSARPLIGRYASGFSIGAAMWLLSVFVPPPYRFALWLLGLAIEFWVPLSAGSRRLQSLLTPNKHHLVERYGLFTIIVLGESFIKVVTGLAGQEITTASLLFSGLAFVISASLWWLYFGAVSGAALKQTTSAPYLWIYTHLPLTIGITAVGVGLKKVALIDFAHPLAVEYRWLICGAVALSLAAIALFISIRTDSVGANGLLAIGTPLCTAVAVLSLALFGRALPEILTVGLLALICAAQAFASSHLSPASTHHSAGTPATEPHGAGG